MTRFYVTDAFEGDGALPRKTNEFIMVGTVCHACFHLACAFAASKRWRRGAKPRQVFEEP
jgi:hypothetical protein